MIQASKISRRWGNFALQEISLSVDNGECFSILGPCGSGKTLVLETIAGLHHPEHGRVLVDGEDITALPPEKRGLGLVYQQYALFPHLSVVKNIAYGLRYCGLDRHQQKQRVGEMLDLLHIGYLASRPSPAGLSGGESQLVALARALAVRPRALLLDEPMSSLDRRTKSRIIDLLQDVLRQLNIPLIHVTHDYTEALALANRIAIFQGGSISQSGTIEEVFHKPANRFVADFLGVENIFEGMRVACDQNDCLISTGEGLKVRAPNTGPQRAVDGAPLAWCIRPEDLNLSPLPKNGDRAKGNSPSLSSGGPSQQTNHFSGRVRQVSDRGDSIRVTLDVADLQLHSAVSRLDLASLNLIVGEDVSVEIPPDRIHLIDNPGQELPADDARH